MANQATQATSLVRIHTPTDTAAAKRKVFALDADVHFSARKCFNSLSTRETEVARLVVSGLPNKAIGRRLKISMKTVEKHRGKVMKKLNAGSVASLMRIWFQAYPEKLNMTEQSAISTAYSSRAVVDKDYSNQPA